MTGGAGPSPEDEVASGFLSGLDRMGIYVAPSGHRAVHQPLLVLLMLGARAAAAPRA